MRPQSTTLNVARILIKILRIFNLVVGVLLVLAVPIQTLAVLRLWMVLTLPMVPAVHVLLSRLLEMVETVRTGDPFVPENAARLKTIAWCVLATQLLHLVYGVLAATVYGSNVAWKFAGLTGWLAVVLLFVLARVFEEGTHMREDLETMI